jgi:predicted transcriptional regulator
MGTEDSIYDEDMHYEDEAGPVSIDAKLLAEPIRSLHRRGGHIAIPPDTTIGEAARIMKTHRIGCVLVEAQGRLVGIFTERDILTKLVGTGYDPAAVRVDAVMTREVETLSPDDPIAFALQRMSIGGFRHVPLVDETGRPVGVLSVKDIVDYLAENFPREVLNIPPEPGKQPQIPEGA